MTPFPFPWAQAVSITMLLFAVTAPFLIVAFTHSVVLAVLMTAMSVQTYIMLNEVRKRGAPLTLHAQLLCAVAL
jgi:hypothetical protein